MLQTEAYAADPSNSHLGERVVTLWRSFTAVNSFYIKLKVCDWEGAELAVQQWVTGIATWQHSTCGEVGRWRWRMHLASEQR